MTKKNMSKDSQNTRQVISRLEEMYTEYLVPMPSTSWTATRNLAQPSMLKPLLTRITYSTSEAKDA